MPYTRLSMKFQKMISLKTHPFEKFLIMKTCNTMCSNLTLVILNNPNLGAISLAKGILHFLFFPIYFKSTNTTGLSSFTINHKWHICCICSLHQPTRLYLYQSVPTLMRYSITKAQNWHLFTSLQFSSLSICVVMFQAINESKHIIFKILK